jgi:YidC/Oxa1 family membrane protein insertase
MLQPQLKEIQNKYKEDKQRQQQELMKFYKENKVNPLGSCLPMVLQLPVFISLYYMLRESLRKDICPDVQRAYQHAYQVAHHVSAAVASGQTTACKGHGGASFLFINDLTSKATGVTLVVLILLYVGTQLASSLMMSSATMDKTQRQMMLVLPLFFVIFIINFPSGLLVYWITTNTWTMAQQFVLRRRLGSAAPAVVATNGAGAPAVAAGGGSRAPAKATGTSNGGAEEPAAPGVLAGLLRGRTKPDSEPVAVSDRSRSRATAPPPSPRKKKKRSGRRR